MKEIPQPVLDLVEHLRSTGTGATKLQALLDLGARIETAEEFLAEVHRVIPEGTLKKLKTYVEAMQQENIGNITEQAPEEQGPSETEQARDLERDEFLKNNPG